MTIFRPTGEQAKAAAHVGAPFRLLAGPGTGKTATLVARVVHLVSECDISPQSIRILTFTRATARELRNRIQKELGKDGKEFSGVSTLHSFALSKLLESGEGVVALPQPLRIADDWEERKIIQEDLKRKFGSVKKVRELLNHLSACWHQSMDPAEDVQQSSEQVKFLGEWRWHREVYGYSLRAELVYQLKLALERRGEFLLAAPPRHLLVDEYQDLNRCDLDVVLALRKHGAEVFVSGDDDQSIYGFRNAFPQGIRRFGEEYPGAVLRALDICQRCAPNILALGEHVANLDPGRIEKSTRPRPDRQDGEVAILRFRDQGTEAAKIAEICRSLLDGGKVKKAEDILILLRNNKDGVYSKPILECLEKAEVPVADVEKEAPLDRKNGRVLLSFMRLAVNAGDSLAWRALLKEWCVGIGRETFQSVYNYAVDTGNTFAEQIHSPQMPAGFRKKILGGVDKVEAELNSLFPNGNGEFETLEDLMRVVQNAASALIPKREERDAVVAEFSRIGDTIEKFSLGELVRNAAGGGEDIEQENEAGDGVRIMTMHKAKGLTAEAVIIAGAENERIPGNVKGEKERGDERRLLYVSLTRAKNFLFVTYCDQRKGRQKYSGKNPGASRRNLTKFLHCYRGCKPRSGEEYILPGKDNG